MASESPSASRSSSPESEPSPSGPTPPVAAPEPADRRARLRRNVGRGAQVFLGLFSIAFAIVVLATLEFTIRGLLLLLGETVVLITAQTVLAGGRVLVENWFELRAPQFWRRAVGAWGLVGLGVLCFSLTAFALFDPNLAETAAVFVLAVVLVLLAFGRILHAARVSAPLWLRGSLMSTGALILLAVVVAISFEGLALAGFGILVGVILLVTGVETVITGLHPTDPRQFVLLKLVLFSAFYGLILINWIDLYGKSVPAYGVWLILTYMAPFGVLIVFQGWRSWPLAASLGLMVSLMNDVGYYFVGNLLFGFHQNLGPWIAGQLGLLGTQVVTFFDAGTFTLAVTSWMMGLSIYTRAVVVAIILAYWWRHPAGIVAHVDTPIPGAPA